MIALPLPQMRPDVIWALESPTLEHPWPDASRLEVRGWTTCPAGVVAVRAHIPGRAEPVVAELGARPDVDAVFGLPTTGWSLTVPRAMLPTDGSHVDLHIELGDDGAVSLCVPSVDRWASDAVRRARKRERIASILQCVVCGSRRHRRRFRSTVCAGCRRTIGSRSALPFDFLPDDRRVEHGVVPTTNVSANDYDPVALDIVRRLVDGLILDCGAGRRPHSYEHVVNLEIVPYESTDVLAVGERLPFADETFDCVFSFAVLEHVRDPFVCASEIRRVLKPGGVVYAQIPFLQPVHAYPNHYYNMTLAGAERVFAPLEVVQAGVFPFGQPVFTLSWFLNSYAAGLPAPVREQFTNLRVGDLLQPAPSYLGAPFVTQLSPAAQHDLACCNAVIARKPATNEVGDVRGQHRSRK